MTRRLFVCHANAEIESTSEVVDALENALDFPAGALLTSGLPGYASDTHDEFALRDTLGGASMVLALVSENTLHDPAFSFQLGAAWALGLRIVLCVSDDLDSARLPAPLRDATMVHPHEPAEWTELIGDLSLRLGLVPRPAASTAPQLAPSSTPPKASVPEPLPKLPPAPRLPSLATDQPQHQNVPQRPVRLENAGVTQPGFIIGARVRPQPEAAASVSVPSLDPQPAAASELPAAAADLAAEVDAAFAEFSDERTSEPEPAPRHTYIDELRSIERPSATETETEAEITTTPRHSYISELQGMVAEEDADRAPSAPASMEVQDPQPAATFVTVSGSEPPLASDIYARLPSCEMALEAGRALSDCVFNRSEISDFKAELGVPFGRFFESLGGIWDELSSDQDIDNWAAAADARLQALPEEARKIEDWYKLGLELAILHNLAGQLVLDGTDAAAEQQWRGALERFLMRAERAEIGYEDLGRVLGLLENLAGPSSERDLANIGRSLAELRRYAAGADGIHTAA